MELLSILDAFRIVHGLMVSMGLSILATEKVLHVEKKRKNKASHDEQEMGKIAYILLICQSTIIN